MKKEAIGKIKMHAQALLDCIAQMEGEGGEDSEVEAPVESKDSSDVAGKSLSMKLGKYK